VLYGRFRTEDANTPKLVPPSALCSAKGGNLSLPPKTGPTRHHARTLESDRDLHPRCLSGDSTRPKTDRIGFTGGHLSHAYRHDVCP